MRRGEDELVLPLNHGKRNGEYIGRHHAQTGDKGRWCKRRTVDCGQRIGYPQIFARLCKAVIELIAFQKTLLVTPAEDRMRGIGKRLLNGQTVCIRQYALRHAGAWHRPRVDAHDVGNANAREAVLIEGGNRHMIETGRNQ